MLKHRIIPILLLKDGRCVKGKRFSDYRDTGNPVTAAKVYDAQRVDELMFLDILASREGRDTLLHIVTETAEECFMPLTVGGGVKDIEDIRELLSAGADKVAINTAAVENPDFINKAAEYFGSANIVISIDYKLCRRDEALPRLSREVYTHGGSKATGLEAFAWCCEVAKRGAGEIVLTSIDQEGTMEGYDLEFIKQVVDALDIPVIAHGGVGSLAHMRDGIAIAGASGVAAASIFHFTDQSPIKARLYLKNEGLDVRV
jgi:imidazole glycerol-phosphate synthase subunit HisF